MLLLKFTRSSADINQLRQRPPSGINRPRVFPFNPTREKMRPAAASTSVPDYVPTFGWR